MFAAVAYKVAELALGKKNIDISSVYTGSDEMGMSVATFQFFRRNCLQFCPLRLPPVFSAVIVLPPEGSLNKFNQL